MKLADRGAAAFIAANSGYDCFDNVDRYLEEHLTGLVRTQWSGLFQVLMSIDGSSITDGRVNVPQVLKVPEFIFIRTPRGAAYSFNFNDQDYIVVDEHLLRQVYRFARLATMSAENSIVPDGLFDELYAERFYLIGNYHAAAGNMASCLRASVRDGSGNLPSSDDIPAIKRSLAQQQFIITHELAHLFVQRLPQGILDVFREQFIKHLNLGGVLQGNPLGIEASQIVAKISQDDVLQTECICDALGLAASISLGGEARFSIMGSTDGLFLLQLLNAADVIASLLTHKKSIGFEIGGQVPMLLERATQYSYRVSALFFLLRSFTYRMINWGLARRIIPIERDVVEAIKKRQDLYQKFVKYQPGVTGRHDFDRVASGEIKPDVLDRIMLNASESRTEAREILGFDKPAVHNVKDNPRLQEMLRTNSDLRQFIKSNPDWYFGPGGAAEQEYMDSSRWTRVLPPDNSYLGSP